MANDIIDINVYETVETVAITVNPNLTTVNINQVTGGGGGGITDLGYIATPTNGTVTSSTGSGATIPLADGTNAGLLTPAEKTKIANSVPYTGATTNVDLGEYEIKAGQVTLDITPTGTAVVGTTRWNDALGSSQTTLKGGTVILKNGVDLVARVVNKVFPNTTLTKASYQAVRVSGATGQRLSVQLAQGDVDLNSADTIGLVTETIATNQEGFIITMGQIEDINTTGSLQGETWVDGNVLYLSPTIAGRLTNIKPTGATGHIVVIGYVEYAHAIHGKIYVKIMNGWELDELHNVYINNPLNNQSLIYETSTQLWKNKSMGLQEVTTINASTTNPINVSSVGASNAITGQSSTGTGVLGISDTGKGIDGSSNTGVGVNGYSEDGVAASFETDSISGNIANFKKTGSIVASVQNNGTFAGTGLNASGQTINTIASFDGSKNVVSLSTTTYPSLTELTYVKGVTSAIQTQLNSKQASNANLTGLSALSYSGSVPFVRMYAPNLFSLDTSTYLTSVGIANLTATGTPSATTYLRGDNTWATVISGATNLTYTPSPTNGIVVSSTGDDATLPLADGTNAGLLKPAKFTVLENTSGTNTGDQDLSTLVVKNAAITAATNTKITYDAKGLVTAGTSLIATDIPTITQAQVTNLTTDLAAKAPLASPTFTGTPSLPTGTTGVTQTAGDNTTKLATTAFVTSALSSGGVTVSPQDTFSTTSIATVTAAQYAAFVTAGTVSATTLYFITA